MKRALDSLEVKVVKAAMIVAVLLPASAIAQLRLSEAERLGAERNPSLAAARAVVGAVSARGDMLQVPYRPQISLNGYGAGGDGSMIFPSTVMPTNYSSLGSGERALANGTFMWRVFSFGRERTARGIQAAETGAATDDVRREELDVALRVRLAFSDALLMRDRVAARQAAVESAVEVERVTRERFDAGKVPEAFLYRAQADTAAMRKDLAMSEAEARASEAMLREAIGLPQSDLARPGDWDTPFEAPAGLDKAIESAVKQRPELASLERSAQGFGLRASLAQKSLLPELSLMAMGDWMGARNMPGELASKVGLVLSFPLSDGGERRAVKAEASAMGAKMKAEYDMALLKVEAEVASAWFTWESVQAVLDAAKSELAASREAYRITLIRYQEGKAILSELTDARSQLVSAEVGAAESEAYRRQAWTRLARSVGQRTGESPCIDFDMSRSAWARHQTIAGADVFLRSKSGESNGCLLRNVTVGVYTSCDEGVCHCGLRIGADRRAGECLPNGVSVPGRHRVQDVRRGALRVPGPHVQRQGHGRQGRMRAVL